MSPETGRNDNESWRFFKDIHYLIVYNVRDGSECFTEAHSIAE